MEYKLFSNPEIFTNESDFSMGGFRTFREDVSWVRMKGLMEERLAIAIRTFVDDELNRESKTSRTEDAKMKSAIILLCENIKSTIGLEVTSYTLDDITQDVINSEHYNCWEQKILIRYKEFVTNHKSIMGVPIEYEGYGVEKNIAEELTEDVNLSTILEILSGIYDI